MFANSRELISTVKNGDHNDLLIVAMFPAM